MTYCFGPEVGPEGTVFRLWAPAAGSVSVQFYSKDMRGMGSVGLDRREDGWWSTTALPQGAGTLYHFRINGSHLVPDPASRYQPEDVHGPSLVVSPRDHSASRSRWRGRPWEEAVLYEVHIGTFTSEGTYAAATRRLASLAETGITAVELLPLSDFRGSRNWGYDGVLPYAPDTVYGSREELEELLQEAHRLGMMVFLDVVYNHFGPEGNYLHLYAPEFFTDRFETPWGAAIDFSREPVRRFFIENALYWLLEMGFDGLRFDAVHAIQDDSDTHILTELEGEVRRTIGPDRHVHLVLENDENQSRYLTRDGGRGYNAQWNDDVHHIFHVLATGETDGYYGDYSGQPTTLLCRALSEGFAYQGDPSPYRNGVPRGEPSKGLPPTAFVSFLQNHDQIGNRPFGERLSSLAGTDRLDALYSVLLLSPQIPMLFMGEEWGTTRPFLYFCDYEAELGRAVTEGRRREFAGFRGFSDPKAREGIPDPNDPGTFDRAILDWKERSSPEARARLSLIRALLTIRNREVVPLLSGFHEGSAECDDGLIRVWWDGKGARLVLCANLRDAAFAGSPEGVLGGRSREEWQSSLLWLSGTETLKDAEYHMGPWSVAWRVVRSG